MPILRKKLFIIAGFCFLLINGFLFLFLRSSVDRKALTKIPLVTELPKSRTNYRKVDNSSSLNLGSDNLRQTEIDSSLSDLSKPIKIGGGGFVTGIVIHPQFQDLMYARTDVGGLYRWDSVSQSWVQLLSQKSVGQEVSLCIESVAIDSSHPNIVYAASGAFTHEKLGNILKSTDYGKTWKVLDLTLPMGGNGRWRWSGERLAVDPHDSNKVYFGSRTQGLWQSSNAGESWTQIDTKIIPIGERFGDQHNQAGVTFVEFNPSSPGVVFVGVAGKGIFLSKDGGQSWQPLTGISNSLIPQQGEVNASGELIVTMFDPLENSQKGGVWKYSGSTWEDITPKNGANYAALAVDPNNPDNLFTMSYPMTPNSIYRSNNGGKTWQTLKSKKQGLDWHPDWSFWTLAGDLAIAPGNSSQVWLTNGLGIWKTDDGNSAKLNWSIQVNGLEETVAFDAISTPVNEASGDSNLITAIADFDGFRHLDLQTVPKYSHSKGSFSTTTSISYSAGNPDFLVRASSSHHDYSQNSGFSTDNGLTWQNFASINNGIHPQDLSFGNIAVSSTDTKNIVWQPTNWVAPYYTKDSGQTWHKINYFDQELEGGAHSHLWNKQQSLTADPIAGQTFYIYHHVDGKVMKTEDGGVTWSVANPNNLLPSQWQDASIKSLPGVEGNIWVSLGEDGLYHSSDGGRIFKAIAGVESATVFGFGKSAPGKTTPTLFVAGKINNQVGIYASTDLGHKWLEVIKEKNYLGKFTTLTGDMNNYGRVYFGTDGNGYFYADLPSFPSTSQ